MMEFDMLLALKVVGVVLIGTYVFVFGFVKKINEWRYVSSLGEKKHRLPPGDMGWPFLGHLLSFYKAFSSSNPDSFIHNLLQRHGRTGIYKAHLFLRPTIIVSMPETCKKVLMDDEKFKLSYTESMNQLTSKWFYNSTPSEQMRLRSLIKAPINGHEELSECIELIEGIVINSLDECSSMNEPVEFLKKIRHVTFRVSANIVFDSTAKSVAGLVEKHYADLVKGLSCAPINFPGFTFHKALKARKILAKIITGVLNERKGKSTQNNHPTEKRGMIDLLMKSEGDNGQKLTDQNIIDLVLILLLAAHETSAYAIMWVIIHLHDHPEMLQKAKKEQEEILKRRSSSTQKGLTFNEIREMNYLHKVIDETLRKNSIVFSIFREAKVDVSINGYLIPKGWKVLVWSRAVHMDPEVHQNPKEFIPARWENNIPKAGSLLPFGAGSRICPGADLAKLEISIFLHYFLLNYKLERVNPGCPTMYLPIPHPADNCLAKIKKL